MKSTYEMAAKIAEWMSKFDTYIEVTAENIMHMADDELIARIYIGIHS